MMLMLLFLLSVGLELAAPWIDPRYKLLRSMLVAVAAGLICAVSMFLIVMETDLLNIFIGIAGLYRIWNLLRIEKGRIHPAYLRRISLRTTSWLAGTQAELYILRILWDRWQPSPTSVWLVVAALQLVIALVVLRTVRRHQQHNSITPDVTHTQTKQLPTVTVAVAARNESESLVTCLESIISSDYPKLEILVLDDCSQNRRTSDIIRSFAHAGVRFVPGKEPAINWLARNSAYDKLATEANGDLIIFCSTSVRMQPDSIRLMVDYATARHKNMLSVLPTITDNNPATKRPKRNQPGIFAIVQVAWELLLPRRLMHRPPVSSTLWLIRRKALQDAGGFAAVSRMVSPEAYFAKATSEGDGYSFMPGGGRFGASMVDYDNDGRTRSIRTAYPSLHRRPEMVAFTSMSMVAIGVMPFVQVAAIWGEAGGHAIAFVSLMACFVLVAAYSQVVSLTRSRSTPTDALLFPITVLIAVATHHYSMYKYDFSEVVWKQRNICIPVMHVVPHLPDVS
jgi:hypothetical protein